MKILTISDTHSKHNQIPKEWLEPADVIIHAGDISTRGYLNEIRDFCEWYSKLNQYKYKIFIAGNHDFGFETNHIDATRIVREYPNIIYLQDSFIEIKGIKIYGSPWQPEFYNWAFNLKRGEQLQKKWKEIPLDTDILITHGPAYGFGDWVQPRKSTPGEFRKFIDGGNVGCEDLLDTILTKLKIKAHICGHIHSGHSNVFNNGINFINASILNEMYMITYEPVVFEI